MQVKPWQHGLGILGVVLLVIGCTLGLTWAPPEKHMGDVSRILYVHVPSAWNALLVYTFAFGFAVASLWTHAPKWDARMVAAVECGMVLNVVLLGTGMLFGRPTWGIWWDWDVRLTTSLLSLILFAGVLALRSFLSDPGRRATWSAVAAIVVWVDVPLIYFCVKWWRSLHQIQSSPETVDAAMVVLWRINAFGVLFLALWFIAMRTATELARRETEQVAPPARVAEATA